MFNSLYTYTNNEMTLPLVIGCTITSIVLGLLCAYVYQKNGRYTKNFLLSLTILPVLVQMVIMMVNGNLGTSVAVLGTFSLVRFRSTPGSSKDICFIFMAMAIGLATGMGHIVFAILLTGVTCLIVYLLSQVSFFDASQTYRTLTIAIPESLDYTEIFEDIFYKYLNSYELDKVKTTNLGSMFELRYAVELKDIQEEKNMIDELRCRNGNLTIISSRQPIVKEEL